MSRVSFRESREGERMTKRPVASAVVATAAYLMMVHCQDLPKLSNLDWYCLRCLCDTATECDLTLNCLTFKGYCGPYKISRVYWIDAGNITLENDDKERAGAYEDCAIHYDCAQKIITGYMTKFGRDCNGDGVTDCTDYMMLHFNGGLHCDLPMDRDENARAWNQRFQVCRPLDYETFRSRN